MMYTASDGNCKLSQFHKNSGIDDKSLFRGNSYFPPVRPYKEFLASAKKSPYVVSIQSFSRGQNYSASSSVDIFRMRSHQGH